MSEEVYQIFDFKNIEISTIDHLIGLFEKQSQIQLNEAIQKAIYLKSSFCIDLQYISANHEMHWIQISAETFDGHLMSERGFRTKKCNGESLLKRATGRKNRLKNIFNGVF